MSKNNYNNYNDEPSSYQQYITKKHQHSNKLLITLSSIFLLDIHKSNAIETSNYIIPNKGFQTKSGLKYFDVREGEGIPPRYGQIISFAYASYYRSGPDSPIEKLDDSGNKPFIHKHGNGRIIKGIDEALHGMKIGGQRRIIVPKSLGYIDFGLGPLPVEPKQRKRLGDVLDYIDKDQGQLIFDLQLVLVRDDENDQGYYDDVAVSQDEIRELAKKAIQNKKDNAQVPSLNLNSPDAKDTSKFFKDQ